jgi:flagellar hook-length control protein FliK
VAQHLPGDSGKSCREVFRIPTDPLQGDRQSFETLEFRLAFQGAKKCSRLADELQYVRAVAITIQLEGTAVSQGSVPAMLNPGAFSRSLSEALEKPAAVEGKNTRTCAPANVSQENTKETGKQTKPGQKRDDTEMPPSKPDAEDAGTNRAALISIPVVLPCSAQAGQVAEISASENVAGLSKFAGEENLSGAQQTPNECVFHAGSAACTQAPTRTASEQNAPLTKPSASVGDVVGVRASTTLAAKDLAEQSGGDSHHLGAEASPVAQQTPGPVSPSGVVNAVPERWRKSVIAVDVITGASDSRSAQPLQPHSSETPSIHDSAAAQTAETITPRLGFEARLQAVAAFASATKVEPLDDVPAKSDPAPIPNQAGAMGKSPKTQTPLNHLPRVYIPESCVPEEMPLARNLDSKVYAVEAMQSVATTSEAQSIDVAGEQGVNRADVPGKEHDGNKTTVESNRREAFSRNVIAAATLDNAQTLEPEVLVRVSPPSSDSTNHIAAASERRMPASVDRSGGTGRDCNTEAEGKKNPLKPAAASDAPLQPERQFHNTEPAFQQQQSTAQRNLEATLSSDISLTHHPELVQESTVRASLGAANHAAPQEASQSELRQIYLDSARPSNTFVHTARILDQTAHAEMRIALRTPETGNLEVRTFVRDGQAGAVIAVEKGEVRNALLTNLPSLQANLKDRHLEVSQVAVTDYGASSGSTGSHASDSGGRQQQARYVNQRSVATLAERRQSVIETQPSRQQSGLSVHA